MKLRENAMGGKQTGTSVVLASVFFFNLFVYSQQKARFIYEMESLSQIDWVSKCNRYSMCVQQMHSWPLISIAGN